MISLASAVVTTDYARQTNCINNKCTTTLYSGTMFAKDNKGNWVAWDKAQSLKDNGFEVNYLEDDKTHKIEVLDFNATSIKVKLDLAGVTIFPYSTDLKVLDISNSSKTDIKNGSVTIRSQRESFNLLKQSVTYVLPFSMNKALEFGKNSTIITLQVANTENLADTYVQENNAASNFGTAATFTIFNSSGANSYGLIQFNISGLSNNWTIDAATLNLNIESNLLDASSEGFNISINHLYDTYSWNETTPTWNTKPNDTQYNLTFESTKLMFGGFGEPSGWQGFNITKFVKRSLGNTNLSIYILAYGMFGAPSGTDYITISTKEASTQTNRPYLNITYTVPWTGSGWCYQETANVSNFIDNTCELNYSGAYGQNSTTSIGYLYTNYSKALNATSASLWKIRFGSIDGSATPYDLNITIPANCWSYSNSLLLFRFYTKGGNPYVSYGQCYDGSWVNITNISSTSGGANIAGNSINNYLRFFDSDWNTGTESESSSWTYCLGNHCYGADVYEEAMYWYISNAPTTQINCTAYSGSDNYTIDCSASCHVNTSINLAGINSIITNGSGTIYFEEAVTNVKSWKGSTGCLWILNKAGGLFG